MDENKEEEIRYLGKEKTNVSTKNAEIKFIMISGKFSSVCIM